MVRYNGCIIFSVGERNNSLPTLNFCGCIIFSVGERKFSPNAKFFCKKIGTHIKSRV